MQRSAAILMIIIMLTAGCSSFLPWSESQPTSTSTPTSLNFPPGANADWILDSQKLVNAHQQALKKSPYRIHARIQPNRTIGSSRWANSSLTAHIAGDRILLQESGSNLALKSLAEPYAGYYWNGAATIRTDRSTSKHYRYTIQRHRNAVQTNRENITDQITLLLSAGDFLSDGVVTRNGTTLYRYITKGSSSRTQIQSLNVTVLIDEDGMIHNLTGTIQPSSYNSTAFSLDYDFWRVSDSSVKPPWVTHVPQLRVNLTNSNVLQLRHTGGAKIPAGTTLSFVLFANSSYYKGEVAFPKEMSPGDTANLTFTSPRKRAEKTR